MSFSLINASALAIICAAVLFLRARISKTREKEARREAFIGTAALAVMLGLSFADGVSLIWPNRGQWQSAMLNVSDKPVCVLAANLGTSRFVFVAEGDGRLRIGVMDPDFAEPMTNTTLALASWPMASRSRESPRPFHLPPPR